MVKTTSNSVEIFTVENATGLISQCLQWQTHHTKIMAVFMCKMEKSIMAQNIFE